MALSMCVLEKTVITEGCSSSRAASSCSRDLTVERLALLLVHTNATDHRFVWVSAHSAALVVYLYPALELFMHAVKRRLPVEGLKDS